MQKIAIPVNQNKLNYQFESSPSFLLFTVDEKNLILKDKAVPGVKKDALPYWLAKKGVTDVIAYTIHPKLIFRFNQFKINVFVGVKLSEPSELIEEFIKGTLETEDVLTEI